MTDPSVLVGRTYGPRRAVPTSDSTERFVEAVGEDARWHRAAPPSWAGAVLFAVAPDFLSDPDVRAVGGGIVHADQTFSWHRPFRHGVPLEVTGRVTRVRVRGLAAWVSFALTATGPDGPVLESGSTFVISGSGPRTVDGPIAVRVDARGANDPTPDGTQLARSASRADLVAYAAASGDLNPIHWDHDSALAAGLPGVVCHGLLLVAWCAHLATHDVGGDMPLSSVKARFRQPVPAGAPCMLQREGDDRSRKVSVAVEGTVAMSFDGVTT